MRRWFLLVSLLMFAPRLSAQTLPSDLAEQWRTSGTYFSWTSSLPENQGRKVQVFYTCVGDSAKPTVVMLHGFPMSGFNFRLVAHELKPDFRSCMLCFPGLASPTNHPPATSTRSATMRSWCGNS
jgi:hypothetical protein